MGLNLNYEAAVLVDTENLSREDWLSWRRRGIGGSDAAAVMGMSPFHTKRDLYYDKRGIQPVMDEEEDNWVAKEVGHRLEELVAEIFSRKTGFRVYAVRKMFQHPLHPFMLAAVDYFIEFASNDSVPANYEYQGRHYMAVMNLDKVYFACLYGNNESEFIIRCVERDLDIEEDLIAEEEFFWQENVEKGVEPPYTEKPDLVLESIRRHCGPAEKDVDQVKLDRKHILSLERYLKLKEEKAQHEGEAKKLDGLMKEAFAGIVEELGVSCSGILKDGPVEYLVSYNPAYRTGIDKKGLERLKVQYPDIYDDYVNTTESRRFSVKKKGAA